MNNSELKAKQQAMCGKMDQRAIELGYDDDIAPVYDGVHDFEGYLDSKLKIMWVMKEPYDDRTEDGQPKGGGFDMTDFTLKLPMFRTMAQIIYGIINEKYFDNIPEPDEEMLNLLQTTAYINICKMPGLSTSHISALRKKMLDWQDILHEQVEDTYNPDIIILGNTYENLMEGHLGDNPKTDWIGEASCPGITAVFKTKSGRVIVDAFHPSPMRKCSKHEITDEVYINTIIKGVLTAIKE